MLAENQKTASVEQKEEIIIELENTFQEITEVGEQEFIATLPEQTKTSYQEIVNDSAEKGFKKTLWVLNIFVVISLVLSLFLPGMKMTEWIRLISNIYVL